MAKKEKSKTSYNSALISGNIIEWSRKRLGRTREQIAEEIGSSVKAKDIAEWESDQNLLKVPDLRTVGGKPRNR